MSRQVRLFFMQAVCRAVHQRANPARVVIKRFHALIARDDVFILLVHGLLRAGIGALDVGAHQCCGLTLGDAKALGGGVHDPAFQLAVTLALHDSGTDGIKHHLLRAGSEAAVHPFGEQPTAQRLIHKELTNLIPCQAADQFHGFGSALERQNAVVRLDGSQSHPDAGFGDKAGDGPARRRSDLVQPGHNLLVIVLAPIGYADQAFKFRADSLHNFLPRAVEHVEQGL
nr:MAG TPA: hypothetical protein [Caudoviricetes sp.]